MNLKKEHLALIVMGIAVSIAFAYVINNALILETEKNLTTNELISKVRECLEKPDNYWKPSGDSTGDVHVRFVDLTKEEISILASKYGIKIFDFSKEYSDGSIFVSFTMRKNLPTRNICDFLNDENVSNYNLDVVLHAF